MATYVEMQQAISDALFRERVGMAVVDIAQDYITTHAVSSVAELRWATRLISKPPDLMEKIIHQLVATNAGLTVSQITGALDANLKIGTKTAIESLILATNKAG